MSNCSNEPEPVAVALIGPVPPPSEVIWRLIPTGVNVNSFPVTAFTGDVVAKRTPRLATRIATMIKHLDIGFIGAIPLHYESFQNYIATQQNIDKRKGNLCIDGVK